MNHSDINYLIWIKESAYICMLESALQWGARETGGVLLGYWGTKNEAVVTKVIGPGPKAVHDYHAFKPDNEYHISEIARIYHESGRTETYLGDWHTHPSSSAYLSKTDKKTLLRLARYKQARLSKPLMFVLGTAPIELNGWLHQYDGSFISMSNIRSITKRFY